MDNESLTSESPDIPDTPSGFHPFWRLPIAITYNDRRRTNPVRKRVRRNRRSKFALDDNEDDETKEDVDDDDRDARVVTGCSSSLRLRSGTTVDGRLSSITTPRECQTRSTLVPNSGQTITPTCESVNKNTETKEQSAGQIEIRSTVSFRAKRYPTREGSSNSLFVNDVIMGPTRPNLRGYQSYLRRVDSCCEKFVKSQLVGSVSRDSSPFKSFPTFLTRPKTSNSILKYSTRHESESKRAYSVASAGLSKIKEIKYNIPDEEEQQTPVPQHTSDQVDSTHGPERDSNEELSKQAVDSTPGPARESNEDLSKLLVNSNDDQPLVDSNADQPRRDSLGSISSDDFDVLNASKNSEEQCESDAFDTDCEPDIKSEFRQKDFRRCETRNDADIGHLTYVKSCKEAKTKPREKIRKQLWSKKVDLRHGGLLSQEAIALALALRVNTRVEEIDLSHNSLPTSAMCEVLEMMTNNIYVSRLSIRGNSLNNNACARQGNEMLNNNSWLTYLDMSGMQAPKRSGITSPSRSRRSLKCAIGDSEIAVLSQGIQDNRHILTLKLSKNKIGLAGALLLGRALGINEVLRKVDLSWNQIRGAGAVAVCNCLKKSSTIEWLDLSWNGIGFEGSLALGEAIRVNRKLKYLNLENNRINWDCAPYLTKALMANRTLEILLLGQNPISMEGCEDIIQALSRNSSNVKTLSLAGIPINTKIALIATDIAKTREFSMDHGGILTTNDVVGNHRATREDPFTLLIRYLSMMGIRVMDLFRMFDKDNKLLVTRTKFIQGLKRVRVPLDDDDILRVAKRLQSNKRGCISYQELANTVRNRIREERLEDRRLEILTRKKREERKRILQSDKPITSTNSITYLPSLYNMYSESGRATRSTIFSPSFTGSLSRIGLNMTPRPILNKSPQNQMNRPSALSSHGTRISPFPLMRHAVSFSNQNIVMSRSASVASYAKGRELDPKGRELDPSPSYVNQFKRQQSSRDFMATSRRV